MLEPGYDLPEELIWLPVKSCPPDYPTLSAVPGRFRESRGRQVSSCLTPSNAGVTYRHAKGRPATADPVDLVAVLSSMSLQARVSSMSPPSVNPSHPSAKTSSSSSIARHGDFISSSHACVVSTSRTIVAILPPLSGQPTRTDGAGLCRVPPEILC